MPSDTSIEKKECYYFNGQAYCSYEKAVAARKAYRKHEIKDALGKGIIDYLGKRRHMPHGYDMGIHDAVNHMVYNLTKDPRGAIQLLEEYIGYSSGN